MASIVQRNNRYNVVYLYDDEATGKRKQKWESFKTMADAKRRKAEIEYRQEIGTMVIHQCKTVDELLKEYVALYGNTLFFIIFPSEYISGRCEIFCLGLRFDCRWIFTRKCAKIGGR